MVDIIIRLSSRVSLRIKGPLMAPMKLIGHLTPRTRRDSLGDWQLRERIFSSTISPYVTVVDESFVNVVRKIILHSMKFSCFYKL